MFSTTHYDPIVMRTLLLSGILMGMLAACTPPAEEAAAFPVPDPGNAGLSLPENFGAFVVDADLGRTRHLGVNDNGDIYAMNRTLREGKGVVALRDTSGDGRADIVESFADSIQGTGMDLHKGYVYFSSRKEVYRAALSPGELLPTGPIETMITFPDSTTQGHSSKPFTFDGAGNMYVTIGSRSNACQEVMRSEGSPGKDPCPELPGRAAIWKFKDDVPGQVQDDGSPYATGIRNAVALDWNSSNNTLYAAQHGRDDLHRFWPAYYTWEESRDIPAEEFLKVDENDDFGWPYCYYDPFKKEKMLAPEYGGQGDRQGRCEGIEKPIAAFPGHWGPNDLLFYTGDQFPTRYKNGAFIAFHGSWNRLEYDQAGFLVAFVPMEAGMPSGDWEIFAQGFTGPQPVSSPRDAIYRPTGLAQGPDGSLYISDDQRGTIWRVMYYGEDYADMQAQLAGQVPDLPVMADTSEVETPTEYLAGKQVYTSYCQGCHMENGMGVPALNPPLGGTDWVTGDKDRLIRVVLNGLNEPIEINGETYQNVMASHGFLSDQQIADVLTYIRNAFGNEASPISVGEVAAERARKVN